MAHLQGNESKLALIYSRQASAIARHKQARSIHYDRLKCTSRVRAAAVRLARGLDKGFLGLLPVFELALHTFCEVQSSLEH